MATTSCAKTYNPIDTAAFQEYSAIFNAMADLYNNNKQTFCTNLVTLGSISQAYQDILCRLPTADELTWRLSLLNTCYIGTTRPLNDQLNDIATSPEALAGGQCQQANSTTAPPLNSVDPAAAAATPAPLPTVNPAPAATAPPAPPTPPS
jgi:hypothetical protein